MIIVLRARMQIALVPRANVINGRPAVDPLSIKRLEKDTYRKSNRRMRKWQPLTSNGKRVRA